MTDLLTDLVNFVYNLLPGENGNLRSALSAHAAKEFRADTKTTAEEMRRSFAISTEFSYDVALALATPANRRGR
jgi:hypothetical protein